jgi:hypothetical protein
MEKTSTELQIPGWLSEKEMQACSGLKTTSLWKLRIEGKLVSSKIGKRTYYQLSSFLDLLENNII